MEVMEVIRDIKMPGWAVKELTPHSPTHLILAIGWEQNSYLRILQICFSIGGKDVELDLFFKFPPD